MTLVATALCADRVTAAPQFRTDLHSTADPIARLAKHLATRLSVKFRRVVPSVGLHQQARTEDAAAPQAPATRSVPNPKARHQSEGSPFQFRLPPPTA
jgi:hypothetical protein